MNKKILIVDDQPSKRRALKQQLVNLDYRVIAEADSVRLGISKASDESPPDIILLDLDFGPDKEDGFDFSKERRQYDKLRSIPVIIVSASEPDQRLEDSLSLGADDYFQYPVRPKFLRARIENLLARSEEQRLLEKAKRESEKALREKDKAEQQSTELLEAIFPLEPLKSLRDSGEIKPVRRENVTVLFSDVVGFTAYSHDHSPEEVVEKLQELVTAFEDVAERNGIEKIKTIGDAFMAAGGLFDDDPDAAFRTVKCGMEMIAAAKELPFQQELSVKWEVRIGIHLGPVVAGKIGKKKYSYDIWGDTVNTAQRAEHLGTPGFVAVTRPVWEKVANRCAGLHCGWAEPKGKPKIELFRVEQIIDPPK